MFVYKQTPSCTITVAFDISKALFKIFTSYISKHTQLIAYEYITVNATYTQQKLTSNHSYTESMLGQSHNNLILNKATLHFRLVFLYSPIVNALECETTCSDSVGIIN